MNPDETVVITMYLKSKDESPPFTLPPMPNDVSWGDFVANMRGFTLEDMEMDPQLLIADPLDNKVIGVDTVGEWAEVVGLREFDVIIRVPSSEKERNFKKAQRTFEIAKREFEVAEKEYEDIIFSKNHKKSKK